MFDILAELFSEVTSDDVRQMVYLSQGQLAPAFEGVELGMSEKLVVRTLSEASGLPTKKVEDTFADTGDLGHAAERLLKGKGGMKVAEVFRELQAIATTSGKGSVDQKINLLSSLLRGVSPKEARYIVRFVMGRLRLGTGDPTMLEALALSGGDRGLRPELERAYNLCSDLGLVAKTLKAKGMKGIKSIRIAVGSPVRMALCERAATSTEALEKIRKFMLRENDTVVLFDCRQAGGVEIIADASWKGGQLEGLFPMVAIEGKYDGLRLQVHRSEKGVEIFSRNLERMTHMFPDIVSSAGKLKCKSMILEGEALAYNESTGELLPFQSTMQRRRKHNIEDKAAQLPLKYFVFELLFLDGKDLTSEPYVRRRQGLESLLGSAGNALPNLVPAEMFVTCRPEDIDAYFEKTIEIGLEGIIVKRLDARYSAGARSFNWIKFKRSYRGELADSVDICIVGYDSGKGKRAGFGIGAVLGAVYDGNDGRFKTVTKIGTGFSEENLEELGRMLSSIRLEKKPDSVDSEIVPDYWVEPHYVASVTADEITRSPGHTAGLDESGKGYALRFPRMDDMPRVDKKPEDATSVEEIIRLYEIQKKIKVK
jgi:DNA ligase-1